MIVDGIYLTAQNVTHVEFDLNAQVSRDLGLPVIAIVGANEASLEEATNAVEVARSELKAAKVDLFSIIVNRADPELRESIEKNVKLGEHKFPVYVLPEIAETWVSLPSRRSSPPSSSTVRTCRRKILAVTLTRSRLPQ